MCERGFGKLISPFSKVIEKRGWGFFCEHKAPGFSALAKEFLCKYGGHEGGFSLCEGCLGTFWG